jgi:hypothetical protein
MFEQFSTRVTAHNFVTYAQDLVTIFHIHKYGSQISAQLLNAPRFCPSAPSLILSKMSIGTQQQNYQITTQAPILYHQHGTPLSCLWTCMLHP